MNYLVEKSGRFSWRAARNLLCVVPWGRNLLFPRQLLAMHFGQDDADYAIEVFLHHYRQLTAAGFQAANKILEVGPGRNIGTSLLMWAFNYSRVDMVTVILWDVFSNTTVNEDTFRGVAQALRASPAFHKIIQSLPEDRIDQTLSAVERGILLPDIRYRVQALSDLIATGEANEADLVYSQATIEHIWIVADFWRSIISLTQAGGWHSHRIDLADHGRRRTNYIEMLEWSPASYWLTMRFIPGAVNRWRACNHIEFLNRHGLSILSLLRETRECLPVSISRIDKTFRSMEDFELRTTAIDIVAVKSI